MRLFRLLSLAYPPRFRRRYRQDLETAFEQTGREPRYAGAGGRVRFWTFILRDLAAASARLWLRQISSRSHPSLPTHPSRNEMDTIIQDISYALRQFVRRPGFAAVGILSLGLAIGANSLIYGLVQGFVLHPFPYPDPDRLVAVGVGFPRISNDRRYVEALSPAESRTSRACPPSGRPRRSIWGTATSPVVTSRSASSPHCCSTTCSP